MLQILGKTINGRGTSGLVQYSDFAEDPFLAGGYNSNTSGTKVGRYWTVSYSVGDTACYASSGYTKDVMITGYSQSNISYSADNASVSIATTIDLASYKRFMFAGACWAQTVLGYSAGASATLTCGTSNIALAASQPNTYDLGGTTTRVNGTWNHWWVYGEIRGNTLFYKCSNSGIITSAYQTGTVAINGKITISTGTGTDANDGSGGPSPNANAQIYLGLVE